MNLKFEIKVSRRVFDYWLQYHRDCGYEVTQGRDGSWYSSAPGYEKLTPAAVETAGRCYVFVRLPSVPL